jgi:hypothetical protein
MFPPQEQTIVSFNKPFIAHLRARQHKPFIHIGKGAIGFTHPPQTPNVVHYAFVDNSSIEFARHLARHDRDLILFAIPDNMNVNEMRNKIGCIGFNPNVSTCTDRFNDAIIAQIDKDFVTYVLDIDKIVNHKPITHKPHKYGKGDWLSKRKR